MDKAHYFVELEGFLTALTAEERTDVIEFYSEYVDEAGLKSRAEIEDKLGTPRQLARKILADYSIKDFDDETGGQAEGQVAKTHSNLRMIWLILLVLITSPITIAILGVILAIFLAVVITVGALAFGFLAAFILTFAVALYTGIRLLFTSLMVGLFYIAVALLSLGLLGIIFPIVFWFFSQIIQGIANLACFLYGKFAKKKGVQVKWRKC